MSLNTAQLATLKTELETDPDALGYGPDHSTDAADADLLNASRAVYRQARNDVDPSEIVAAVPYAVFSALRNSQNPEQEWLMWQTALPVFQVNAGTLRALAGIGGTSLWAQNDRATMNPAMEAILRRDGSRAEALFGTHVRVTPSDVARARDLP